MQLSILVEGTWRRALPSSCRCRIYLVVAVVAFICRFCNVVDSYLIPECESGAGALPALIVHLESTDISPKIGSFGFSQNTLEEVFVKVSSDAMDFKPVGEACVALKPLGARVTNGGLYLMVNQLLAIMYCRLVQLAPARSFMLLLVFFSLSFGVIILAGCISAIQLPSNTPSFSLSQQPSLLLTPAVAFKNHLVSCYHAFQSRFCIN